MGVLQANSTMNGWLYLIESNRLGLLSSKKRYIILEDDTLKCFKSMPTSYNEVPRRSVVIDSCIRVKNTGRESISRNVFFVFTLYSASNHNEQLKLGARSAQEAAKWIQSFMNSISKQCQSKSHSTMVCSGQKQQNRVRQRKGHTHSRDWTLFTSIQVDPLTSDVVAPSPWAIFGCENGLRLFKEAKENDLHDKDDHPAVMAVGVVDASSEAIFKALMSLGPLRLEWDFCYSRGTVIETLDDNTDIIHKQFNDDWLPWGMKPRDLLLQRYWRREDDGAYVILYHSVFHEKCRTQRGFIRAYLKSGGYVISPTNQGKQSVVKHMLAIDWKSWKSYLFTSSSKYITIRMLSRVAALREFFKAKLGSSRSDFTSDELTKEIRIAQNDIEEIKEVETIGDTTQTVASTEMREITVSIVSNTTGSFLQHNDAIEEFFDVQEPSDYEDMDIMRSSYASIQDMHSEENHLPRLTTTASFIKRWPDVADDLDERKDDAEPKAQEEKYVCYYGSTLPKDSNCDLPCSWTMAEASTFLIRGATYLQDQRKTKANGTLMQMVAADWLKSDKREDDLAGRPNSIVQKYAAQGGDEFFLIINIQIPGSTTYNLALYYMMETPLEHTPLLEKFVNGDNAYRNSRFKLIPYISKGSWIVKQSVGKKACLVGQGLDIHYFRGRNYLELGIDVGSSSVARGVVSLVLGYLNSLVMEMAFLLQATDQEELPEFLLGTCRLNHLDSSQAVQIVE